MKEEEEQDPRTHRRVSFGLFLGSFLPTLIKGSSLGLSAAMLCITSKSALGTGRHLLDRYRLKISNSIASVTGQGIGRPFWMHQVPQLNCVALAEPTPCNPFYCKLAMYTKSLILLPLTMGWTLVYLQPAKRLTEQEAWEARQLQASGVVSTAELPFYDEESGGCQLAC